MPIAALRGLRTKNQSFDEKRALFLFMGVSGASVRRPRQLGRAFKERNVKSIDARLALASVLTEQKHLVTVEAEYQHGVRLFQENQKRLTRLQHTWLNTVMQIKQSSCFRRLPTLYPTLDQSDGQHRHAQLQLGDNQSAPTPINRRSKLTPPTPWPTAGWVTLRTITVAMAKLLTTLAGPASLSPRTQLITRAQMASRTCTTACWTTCPAEQNAEGSLGAVRLRDVRPSGRSTCHVTPSVLGAASRVSAR